MSFISNIPTKVLFGCGMLDKLFEQKLPGTKALIVTTAGGSARRNGYLDKVTSGLDRNQIPYIVFDKIITNPEKAFIEEAAKIVQDNGIDFIIGLGGGSSIDSAKAISVLSANKGDLWDYYNGGSGKGHPLHTKPLPVVAISTTSGTGTEADPWMVVTKTETNEKIGFGNDDTYPVISVCDPLLTLSVPPFLSASQGFDVLFHCAESCVSNVSNELSELYALKAISIVGKSLPTVVRDGNNVEARSDMAFANLLAGYVQSISSSTAEHSMAHAISAFYPKVPHGIALVLITEAYFSEVAQSGRSNDNMIAMAKAMGITDAKSPFDFVTALSKLIKDTGLDSITMSGYGITKEILPKLAVNARETMGGLITFDSMDFTDELATRIFEKSYR